MNPDKCPRCESKVRFFEGRGPYCPECEWRSDDKPRRPPMTAFGGQTE